MYYAGKILGEICLKAIRDLYPFVGHPDLTIKKTLRRVLGLLTVMILKSVIEGIFFQSNKFTACKVKDEKEVANCLMVFSLLKIINPFDDLRA